MAGITYLTRQTVHYRYVPAEDITLHELARLVPVLIRIGQRDDVDRHIDGPTFAMEIEGLSEDLRRHFEPSREVIQTLQ